MDALNFSHCRAWADSELAPWRWRGLTRASVSDLIDAAVFQHGCMFRYDIGDGQVACRDKPGQFLGPGVDPDLAQGVRDRAQAYRRLLERSLPLVGAQESFAVAIDVSDGPPEDVDAPYFCFQKLANSPRILLPDIDLILRDYFQDSEFVDATAFSDKQNKAIFVGSTTGELITQAKLDTLSVPRLRAAAAFKTSSNVVFSLPNVVQCDGPQTEAAVRAMGFGDRPVGWPEQLGFRHLISIDGNGATCSRVAIALNSQSVLLKYDSPHQLFYFKGLEPWVHYIPVRSDAEVERIVLDSAHDPRRYERIALEGRRFFQGHLTAAACTHYVATLLRRYLQMLKDGEALERKSRTVRARRLVSQALVQRR